MYLDVDECQTNNGGCAQMCANAHGSFQCSCDIGYILAADNFSCTGMPNATKSHLPWPFL